MRSALLTSSPLELDLHLGIGEERDAHRLLRRDATGEQLAHARVGRCIGSGVAPPADVLRGLLAHQRAGGRDVVTRRGDAAAAREQRGRGQGRDGQQRRGRCQPAPFQKFTTLRIESPECIRSNASLMRASGNWCVMRSSMLILPCMYQSTIFGTSVRPRAPPNAVPFHTRPVTS